MKKLRADEREQWRYGVQAALAAKKGKRLFQAGKRREAVKCMNEADKWLMVWRAYGGKGRSRWISG